MKVGLERYVRPIRIEPGRIELSLTEEAPPSFVGELARHLGDWTGRRWVVTVGRETGGPTVHERAAAARAQMVTDARADPLVAAVMERFPGAEIVDVRVNTPPPAEVLQTLPLPADAEADEDERLDD
jgi:DNA polymerase-3 subunit gamma/tau